MPITLKYDLQGACEAGHPEHPQTVMEQLGYKVLAFEGHPIFDCVVMEVESIIEPLPNFLSLTDFVIQ